MMKMRHPELLYYDLHDDVVAFSSTRRGGYSSGNYAEFNINRFCGDDEEAISKNRSILCQTLGIDDHQLIMPHQVHQSEVAQIDEGFCACTDAEKSLRLEGIDAVMTHLPNVCIGVSTADCIPLLIYDSQCRVVAAIHAGWRGTVKRIARETISAMHDAYGSMAHDMIVQIGPGISLDSFEVGDEVYAQFEAAGFDMRAISQRREKWHINLPECNRLQLIDAGVPACNIRMTDICTVKQSSSFFSARCLGIQSGRILTGIMMK